jgi:hypothetical protein
MTRYPLPAATFVRGTRGGKIRQGTVVWYEQTPALGTNTAVLAATALADAVATVITTALTAPDVPRVLLIKGNAAGMAGDVLLEGTDANGTVIRETLALNGATCSASPYRRARRAATR